MSKPMCPVCHEAELMNGREVCQSCSSVSISTGVPLPKFIEPVVQREGAVSLSGLMETELDAPLPGRVRKVLDTAEENGWHLNGKGVSLCIRLDRDDHPDAVPFYATWLLTTDKKTGNKSWRFWNSGAANSQSLNYNDVLTYLADPSVIWPDPPEERDHA